MPPLAVMFKTVSSDCNLDCRYCYYRRSLEGRRARRVLDAQVLERFIPAYMDYISDTRQASFAWQGGEPTLAGLEFFERVVGLQARHAAPGTTISNALQTNAVLLDDRWGDFLATYSFLVGVSIDGPESVHDRFRVNLGGRGTFRAVMGGVDVLRRHGVDLNVLCVLGPHNIGMPRELMRFFLSEGFSHIQFIPAMNFQATEPEKPASYLVTPDEYGSFLVAAFDEWLGHGRPGISVRIFDNFLQTHLGIPNELCVHATTCDAGLVVEWDGSAYPCDFFIHPRWKLGNVLHEPLHELAAGARRLSFVTQKEHLPGECARCNWLPVCKSGCPRNRPLDGTGTDYFCDAYKQFFSAADTRLRELASRLRPGKAGAQGS